MFGENNPCQKFTAIGIVTGKETYPYDMGGGFISFRRDIRYLEAIPTEIKPLIENLQLITNKKQWGYKFRFGAFEIPEADFNIIARSGSQAGLIKMLHSHH